MLTAVATDRVGNTSTLTENVTVDTLVTNFGATGGPIAGHHEVNVDGAGVSFGVHLVDVEVDPETGRTTVLQGVVHLVIFAAYLFTTVVP